MILRSLVPLGNESGRAMQPAAVYGSLHREIDRLFDDLARGAMTGFQQGRDRLVPTMDVVENDNEIVVAVEMPGLRREDIDISIDDDVLTIRGEKKVEERQQDEKKNFHVTERAYGVFYRAIQLPSGIDPSKVEATMENGVLKITIPKPARSGARKIEVHEAASGGGQQQDAQKAA
jgi:HSP20 family protein